MTKRFKLALAATGFLGVNGAVIPTLGKSLNLFQSVSIPEFRGGLFFGPNKNPKTNENAQLSLKLSETKYQKLNLEEDSSKLSEVKLDLNDSDTKFVLQLENLFEKAEKDQSILEQIQKAFKEISKEGQINSINRDLNSQYNTITKRYLQENQKDSHLKNLDTLKNKLKTWKSKPQDHISLTPAERSSLRTFFQTHTLLTQEKKKFSEELDRVSEIVRLSEARTDASADVSKVVSDLYQISWENSKIKTHRDRRKQMAGAAPDWGKWDDNPYRHFYENEEEFQNALKTSKSKADRIKKLEGEMARTGGMWGSWKNAQLQVIAQKNLVKTLKASSNGHIEATVASKILSFMNQPV